jgi:hypothetical protein
MKEIVLWLLRLLTGPLEHQELAGSSPRSTHWPKTRREHLEKFPECAACGGTEHLEVHHCIPFSVDPSKENDPDNLITLCGATGHNCHFVFGHFHDWLKYNPHVRKMVMTYRIEHDKAKRDNA